MSVVSCCNNEFFKDGEITSYDVNAFYVYMRFLEIQSIDPDQLNTIFWDLHNTLVSSGEIVDISSKNSQFDVNNIFTSCFNFDAEQTINDIDFYIYSVYQAWRDAHDADLVGTREEFLKFIEFYKSLDAQGCVENLPTDMQKVPSLKTENFIFNSNKNSEGNYDGVAVVKELCTPTPTSLPEPTQLRHHTIYQSVSYRRSKVTSNLSFITRNSAFVIWIYK